MTRAVSQIRFKVEPGDVPPEIAARRLGLPLDQFQQKLPELLRRGFPAPDTTTGNFDLAAVDMWRKRRCPHLFSVASADGLKQDREIARTRIAGL
jgi:hypothetical protein